MADVATYDDSLSESEAQYQREFDRGTRAVQQARAAGAAKQVASQTAASGLEAAASRFGPQAFFLVRAWQFVRRHPRITAALLLLLMAASILTLTLFLAVAYSVTQPSTAIKIGFQAIVHLFFPNAK